MAETPHQRFQRTIAVQGILALAGQGVHPEIEIGDPGIIVTPVGHRMKDAGGGAVVFFLECLAQEAGIAFQTFAQPLRRMPAAPFREQYAHPDPFAAFVQVAAPLVVGDQRAAFPVIDHIGPVTGILRVVHLLVVQDKPDAPGDQAVGLRRDPDLRPGAVPAEAVLPKAAKPLPQHRLPSPLAETDLGHLSLPVHIFRACRPGAAPAKHLGGKVISLVAEHPPAQLPGCAGLQGHGRRAQGDDAPVVGPALVVAAFPDLIIRDRAARYDQSESRTPAAHFYGLHPGARPARPDVGVAAPRHAGVGRGIIVVERCINTYVRKGYGPIGNVREHIGFDEVALLCAAGHCDFHRPCGEASVLPGPGKHRSVRRQVPTAPGIAFAHPGILRPVGTQQPGHRIAFQADAAQCSPQAVRLEPDGRTGMQDGGPKQAAQGPGRPAYPPGHRAYRLVRSSAITPFQFRP